MRQSPQITITTEVIDYNNDDTEYGLHKEEFSIIFEADIPTDDGIKYEIPEEYGRVVAFHLKQHSSVRGDERETYRNEGYQIDPEAIIPISKCSIDSHL